MESIWNSAVLNAHGVSILRSGVWMFSEPQQTGATPVEAWLKVADVGAGGNANLISNSRATALTIALPATDNTAGSASDKAAAWSAWTNVLTQTISASGFYIIKAELDVSSDFPHGGGGRYFSETRIVRTRATVDTNLAERHDYHRNFDVGSDPDHWLLIGLDRGQANDNYKIQARVRRQATANASPFNTNAYNTTWSNGCTFNIMRVD